MKKSILIVDDDAQLRSVLSSKLTSMGYIVHTLENGKQCVNYIRQNTPNIILIDCFMPEMDGLTAIKIMQNEQIKIPMIMMSSDKIKNNGFLFLRKPFHIENLIDMIEEVCNSCIY